MMLFLWLASVFLVLLAGYLWLIAPAREAPDATGLDGWLYAHRGLHDGNEKIMENSLPAFAEAVEAGYGIELDVQCTRDGQLVVFHDGDLMRMCGADRRVAELTLAELQEYPLPDGSPIPLFSEALSLVDGQLPLIVEIKHHGSWKRNAQKTLEILQMYQGAYCVESFHPLIVRYFREQAPEIMRGQLAYGGLWNRQETKLPAHLAMKHLLMNVVGRPHFVAYSCAHDHILSMWLMKHFFMPWLAAWTIRDQKTLEKAQKEYQWLIFERFAPHR